MKHTLLLGLSTLTLAPTPTSSAQPANLAGQMLSKAQALGFGSGSGAPQTLTKGGFLLRFDKGNVYSSKNGIFVAQGKFLDTWGTQQWEQGFMGYPKSDDKPCTAPYSRDRYQLFDGRRILYSTATNTAKILSDPSSVGQGGDCHPSAASSVRPHPRRPAASLVFWARSRGKRHSTSAGCFTFQSRASHPPAS